jgi:hypothetical protein
VEVRKRKPFKLRRGIHKKFFVPIAARTKDLPRLIVTKLYDMSRSENTQFKLGTIPRELSGVR